MPGNSSGKGSKTACCPPIQNVDDKQNSSNSKNNQPYSSTTVFQKTMIFIGILGIITRCTDHLLWIIILQILAFCVTLKIIRFFSEKRISLRNPIVIDNRE